MPGVGRVDDGDSATAEAYVNPFGFIVVADIVRVVLQIQLAQLLEGFSVEEFANAAFVICNKQSIEPWNISDALWGAEAGDRMNSLSFAEIHNFNAVVTESANEQSFTGGIECEMVNSSFNARQRNLLL